MLKGKTLSELINSLPVPFANTLAAANLAEAACQTINIDNPGGTRAVHHGELARRDVAHRADACNPSQRLG